MCFIQLLFKNQICFYFLPQLHMYKVIRNSLLLISEKLILLAPIKRRQPVCVICYKKTLIIGKKKTNVWVRMDLI